MGSNSEKRQSEDLNRTEVKKSKKNTQEEDNEYAVKHTFYGHYEPIAAVEFSPSGSQLSTCAADKYIKIWDTDTCTLNQTLKISTPGTSDVSWSHDERLLVSGSDDTKLRIWDVKQGNCLKKLKGHSDYVFCCGFSPDSKYIASGSFDTTTKIWDSQTYKCLLTFDDHDDVVTSVDFDAVSSTFVTSSLDGCCQIRSLKNGQVTQIIQDRDNAISCAKFSPNGKYILYASQNNKIVLHDITAKRAIRTYTGHKMEKHCAFINFCISSKEPTIISGSEDNLAYIWDLNLATVVKKLEGHTNMVLPTSCHPTKEMLATGSNDCTVKLWTKE